MNLNIDDFGGKSIVPVYCGSYISGTAFFVSPTKLLTASHVLAEYILDNGATVAIIIEGDYKYCRVLYNNNCPDVAVLECVDFQSPQHNILKLLDCKFKKGIEALIVGYPRELGNAEDYFGITVKNSREMTNLNGGFDRMVVRTDSFGFNSYEGFSGAPVINDFGLVIGIQTDQLYNTLGYASIKAIKPFIKQYIDAEIEDHEDFYDNTPYGLRTCRNHILSHTSDLLKTRYNDKVHVENTQNENSIQSFCGYGIETERLEIFTLFQNWYAKLAGSRKTHIDSIRSIAQYLQDGIITDISVTEIEGLLYESDIEKELPSDYHKELRKIYRRMVVWIHNQKLYDNEQFLYIKGAAGCGKSHLLYYLSERMTISQHIYMFLGSEFSSLEDPIITIARIMGWRESAPLESLNAELQQNGNKKATIIIDALNEGAGTQFWIEQLPILKEQIRRCSQLKLIVSLREISKEDRLNEILRDGWILLNLDGFTDREKAIKEYFDAYNIKADITPYTKIQEFNNPLFLKIFCETYYSLSYEERDKVLRLPIYRHYLQKRNYEVSYGVDEDPKQDITTKYILWVALRSMEAFNCEDMPRQLAYRHSRKMCPYRTWKNSLLKNCLDANLLREYSTQKGDFVDFEFDSMGDYLKAYCLLNRKCEESDRFRTIRNIFDVMDDNYKRRNGNWQKQYNFIRAFLSIWNPPTVIWQNPIITKGQMTSILLSCLPDRNVRDDENTLTPEVISNILQQNPDYIEPQLMLQNLMLYSQNLIDHVHNNLLQLSMAERDLRWTTKVNNLFEGAIYKDVIESLNPTLQHEIKTLLVIQTWMLSSSFPYLRTYIIRKIKKLLDKYSYESLGLIEKFHMVDDPYILEGLYAAIYGVMVNQNNAVFSRPIAESLYAYHYTKDGKAPRDLMVRYWTLKIFELAAHQDPTIDIWGKAQPPYKPEEDIFSLMPDEDYEADGYFGDTYGGKQITRSLFYWDFSRYIIGTNNSTESRVFYNGDNPVALKKIEHAIAFLIKHRFGWNDDLGKYDAEVPYQTRHENSMERIGKKYQWIGLYQVYAYLCDTCKLKIDIWSANERFAERNYPWYAPIYNYFDPTLLDNDIALQESHKIFTIITPTPTMQIPAQDWLKDKSKMPPLYGIVVDRKGLDWIPLQAYSTIKEGSGEDTREQFVYYNGFFVANKDYEKFKEWATKTNFYGRWMPEHSGSIDYKWNEFPWADSYQQIRKDDNSTFNEGGGDMKLAYSAQLQEDFMGIPEDDHYLSTAYVPNADIMETMHWHTAERGIIRNIDGVIMAINRNILDDPLHALLIRRKQLDEYLTKKELFLFWSLVGEKQVGTYASNFSITRLTGAMLYTPEHGIDIIQPLRNEPLNKV